MEGGGKEEGAETTQITVDIDSPSKAALLSAYRRALKFGKTRITQTKKGWHLYIESDIADPWEILRIRRLLRDDPKRLEHDRIMIEMGFPELSNRLFQWKRPLGRKEFVKEKPFDILKLDRGDYQ